MTTPLAGAEVGVPPATISPVTPSAELESVPCGSSAAVPAGGETPVASGSRPDVNLTGLLSGSPCGGEVVSPTGEKDDVFGAESSGAGILGQTSSSPQLTPFQTGFGQTFGGLTPSESRKRGKVDIFCLVLRYFPV